ncbi:hypothetical protein INT47_005795 [Mucor saturninus]|uniref:Uncharacterized protein n=1 Tax=Mucor saturninus TaxID=64648 RepID=A0A8H7QKW9_9FUNG|nr:hypothetical protein INT47_005795 [Mucor saturninus]
MKLIITLILILVIVMSVKAHSPTFQLIDPNTNTSWTAGTMEGIVWKYASEKNELIHSIELITPDQSIYLFNQEDAVSLSSGKYNWMLPSDIIPTNQASVIIITSTFTYKAEFNFKIEARDKVTSVTDYFTSATASQPDLLLNISNLALSASDENNHLKYTAIFIILFNLSIFIWI